jgi:N-acetylmuramoyl-L-alanine amidase
MLPSRGTLRLYDAPDGEIVLIPSWWWHDLRREGEYQEAGRWQALWALNRLPDFDLVKVRVFVADAELRCPDRLYALPKMGDHELWSTISRAIDDHRIIAIRKVAGPTRHTPGKGSSVELRRLIEHVEKADKLSFQGRQYKLAVAGGIESVPDRDRYEVVPQADARAVLEGLAKQSPSHADDLHQASEKISQDWRHTSRPEPEGLVLLRRVPAPVFAPKADDAPAITPSRMKALVEKANLEIHLVDLNGISQKDIAFEISKPDGGVESGKLDEDGRARAQSSKLGTFVVKFPELDGADWDGDGALELPDEERSEAGKQKVQQGDRLLTIARKQSFYHWQTVWDFAGNSALKDLRRDPCILLPGDQVAIPSKLQRVAEVSGGKAEYVLQSANEILRVRFTEADFGGDRQARFVAKPDQGPETSGALASDGTMQIDILPGVAKINVDVFVDDNDQPQGRYELAVGHLDPVEEISGVQARLGNLGYYSGPITGSLDDATRRAISAFRLDALEEDQDGQTEIDTAVTQALSRAYHL